MRKSAMSMAYWMALIVGMATDSALAASSTAEELNKQVVSEFYDMAFNQHKPAEAMDKYVGDHYTQHNPFVADGKKPFVDFFLGYQKKHPESHADIKKKIAEGDLVVVHVKSQESKSVAG